MIGLHEDLFLRTLSLDLKTVLTVVDDKSSASSANILSLSNMVADRRLPCFHLYLIGTSNWP